MRENSTSLAPDTVQDQGRLFGEIIADRVIKGQPITEILTHILSVGPISLREAIYVARVMQPVSPPVASTHVEPHTLRDDNTPSSWGSTRVRSASRDKCAICNGPAHEYYPPDPTALPSGF